MSSGRPLHLTGSGFGFWWAWGYLETRRPSTAIVAVSGSALAAACYLCELDVGRQLVVCDALRPAWGGVLAMAWIVHRWLDAELPADAHVRCTGRLVVLTRRLSGLRIARHTEWSTRDELIRALVAAACPLRWTRIRGEWHTDCLRCAALAAHTTVSPPVVYRAPTVERARALVSQGRVVGALAASRVRDRV